MQGQGQAKTLKEGWIQQVYNKLPQVQAMLKSNLTKEAEDKLTAKFKTSWDKAQEGESRAPCQAQDESSRQATSSTKMASTVYKLSE